MITHSFFSNLTAHQNVSLPDPWIPPLSLPLVNQFGHFEAALKQKFLLSKKMIKPLKTVLMNRDHRDIKLAMTKNEGYWSRLFSTESWDEWSESKTELGRVTELFADFIENGAPFSSIEKRLDSKTIRKAIDQAHEALQNSKRGECFTNIALGTMMTISTQNPLPLAIATTSCLHGHASAIHFSKPTPRPVTGGLKDALRNISSLIKEYKDFSGTAKKENKDLSGTAKKEDDDLSITAKKECEKITEAAKKTCEEISNTATKAREEVSEVVKKVCEETTKKECEEITEIAKEIYNEISDTEKKGCEESTKTAKKACEDVSNTAKNAESRDKIVEIMGKLIPSHYPK